MRFCQAHWEKLRSAIDDRKLTPFIAKNGQTAIMQLAKQLDGDDGKATFDPLMSAHWAITNNVMSFLDHGGLNSLYLMIEGPEDPITGYPGHEGETWPRCPICYINVAHELSCTHPSCKLDKKGGYDWMIVRAADESLERARKYGLVP